MKPGGENLPALAVKRPLLAAVFNLLIIIAGLAALLGVEVRELPDVDRPSVTVTAEFPGAAPETVDAEVTSVLEGAAARVSGVRDIRSSSEENNTRIRISFNPGVDLDTAANDVREAVSRVQRQLPDRVEQVNVLKADSDAEPIMQLAVVGRGLSEEALTQIVDTDIAPELQSVDGVASIGQFGARERQLRVVLDPLRLSRFSLAVSDVAAALRQAPFDVPVGSFRSEDQQLLVRAEATAATPDLIADVIIQDDVRIGDVADVYFSPANATSFVRLDGEPVIGLDIIRQAQSNTIKISSAVAEKVEALNERFDTVQILINSDDAQFIRGSVREVTTTLFVTIAIVVAVIWLFFGSAQATLAPSLAIPTALIGAVAGLWLMGFSINLLTLLALVLATGLIVDDAIVVLENIQRLQTKGYGRRAAAAVGAQQVFFAVVATTAVLVAVFVPIAFLPSTTGRLFREFGFVLAFAVVLSTLVALTATPALGARLKLSGKSALGPFARAGSAVSEAYRRTLGAALDRPWAIAIAGVVFLGSAVGAFLSLEQELTPTEDRGRIYIFARGPDGVGIDFMERQADKMQGVLEPLVEAGEIQSVLTIIGRWDPNIVYMTAPLADWSERGRTQDEIIASLRGPLSEIPGVRASVFGRGSLQVGRGGFRSGVEAAFLGPDYQYIYETARAFSNEIEAGSNILSKPEISYQPTQPQLSIKVDRRRAADLGVPLDALSQTLRAMVGGDEIIDLNVADQAIPIVLQSSAEEIASPDDLANLYVRADSGALIPLSTLTDFIEEGVAAELDRTEQRRAIELEADIAEDVTLDAAIAEMRRIAERVLPGDIDMVMQGAAATLNESSRDMALTYAFALIIVLLVLVAQFESLASPLVILLTVPFALAAAVFAIAATGGTLNIFSQIGLVLLIGLMAKNSILVVEFADQLRSEGASLREAIETSAAQRLRPIMMTLISTVLGAVPLILSSGAGAEARSAIGWVVFGGLGVSGLITLLVTPVLYLGVARFAGARSDAANALEAELAEARTIDPKSQPAE
ncbi:MAG: efflux RND transporter permease subunit [Pseudomonadota bacterium]